MAKPRKPKASDEAKPDNYGAVVQHQKLCLSIDLDKRRIYGYTEIEISVPEIGIVALHAENLMIESVFVDGEPADFEYYPRTYYRDTEYENRWGYGMTSASAADAAGMVYGNSVRNESEPTLLVSCCKGIKHGNEHEDQVASENGVQQSSGERETKQQNVKLLRINYCVEKEGSGIHIDGNVLHADNQIRRARCWFPCVDNTAQRCCYDLEFTVAQNLVAVSTGSLLYQVFSKEDPPRKTYVYKLDVPVNAQWISLAVGPFEILPDQQFGLISHMCLPANLHKLRNTVEFFHSAFSCYKDYLSVNFPFGSYKQVFIEPQMTVSSLSLGASMSIFSSEILFDEKIIDQTIDTRIKLAHALAKQWFGVYITPETPNDEWLLDGLAGFLTDLFIKKYLGNNEARYRRYKANCAVCKADDSGATSLSSSASSKDLYGTQAIGVYGKIRSWKSVAVLQMLEKQMGPESFKKILQMIVSRAENKSHPLRSLSTKEFRHFANKVGNLERPFLKDFFPRWVASCGCPMLRTGFSYNKRKNMIELAVLRGCTAAPDTIASVVNKTDSENKDGDTGWPGMMSIRVYELDGTFDHPVLPMSGDSWQLVEIQCHSKLAARRFQKPKKALKPDGSDENGEGAHALDTRPSMESPLLWMRADPEMEYLAKIHFNQPLQMWVVLITEASSSTQLRTCIYFLHDSQINQLEKDKDVIAQAQAIVMLETSPQISFSIITALNNFLNDSKVFWRVRIEAAFALANTASEDTDWAGLLHLVKFYKSRRFDVEIGLPKPNDFHDFAEYFVLEAIPHAISMVRTADGKSPREAVEFILQLLKYNDNSGNPYSDVFWLSALIQSVGELEFGQQSILFLSSLLKRIDRLLQFDRLMPSHNGILTVNCIRSLTQTALKLSGFVPLDRIVELVKPFRDHKAMWQVRIEASRALLDLKFHGSGIDAALSLFIQYVEEEQSLRGQVKLVMYAMRLCQTRGVLDSNDEITSQTLLALLRLLEGRISFSNIFLRHHLFCILQILGGRPPTLYGIPRDSRPFHLGVTEAWQEQKNMFGSFVSEIKPPSDSQNLPQNNNFTVLEASKAIFAAPEAAENGSAVPEASRNSSTLPEELDHVVPEEPFINPLPVPETSLDGMGLKQTSRDGLALAASESSGDALAAPDLSKDHRHAPELSKDGLANSEASKDGFAIPEPSKEADTVSTSHGRKRPVVKIRMKRSAATSRADDQTADRSQGGAASSSVSVDAPPRSNFAEVVVSLSNHNAEEVNSCHDVGSRMTASIGSAKLAGEESRRELQCTADSGKVTAQHPLPDDPPSSSFVQDKNSVDAGALKFASLHDLSAAGHELKDEKKGSRKDKEKKRKRDDPDYLERKRLKKEKKKKEKEKEKSKPVSEAKMSSVTNEKEEIENKVITSETNEKEGIENKVITAEMKQVESDGSKTVSGVESKPVATKEVAPAVPKFRIKIKNRTLNKS